MNSLNLIKTIGMDMVYPYGIYVNNELVSEYETEQEASAHYERLRLQGEGQKTSNKPS